MLQPEYSSVRNNDGAAEMAATAEIFQSILDFLRRQYRVIGLAVAIVVTMGFIYLLTTPSSYTATATMLIDTKKVQLFQQQSMFSEMPIDAGSIESQVEILKSENIALAVIKRLNLTDGSRICQSRRRTDRDALRHCDRIVWVQRAAFRICVESCSHQHIQ